MSQRSRSARERRLAAQAQRAGAGAVPTVKVEYGLTVQANENGPRRRLLWCRAFGSNAGFGCEVGVSGI